MKKIIYTTSLFLISVIALSQVSFNNNGISKGIFYVNPTGSVNEKGGLIITENGYMGIGTNNPTEKLEVVGNMSIADTDSIKGNLKTNNNILVSETSKLRILGKSTFEQKNVNSNNKSSNISPKSGDDLQYNLEIISNTPKGALKFNNGSQKKPSTTTESMIPVLTIDPAKNSLTWVNIPSVTTVKTCNLLNEQSIGNSEKIENAADITESQGLFLEEGLWLILASIPTDNGANASRKTNGLYVYMILTEDSNPLTEIARVGAASENSAGYGVATPQLTYPLIVPPTGGTYRIKICTSIGANNGTSAVYRTNTAYGNSYFYAIKLDYKNDSEVLN